MKTVKNIIISTSEPTVNNVGWLKPISNGDFMLLFFGDKGWTPVSKGSSGELDLNHILATKEDIANKVTSINADADDTHYPSAKAVYNAIEDKFWYGIEKDITVSTPTCTRIGNMVFHRTLPIHSLMRGCLLADDGTVNKYLDPDDWTSEVRDGSQGQVMVEIPRHFRKCETDGNIIRVKLSLLPLDGFHEVPKMYVSAYEAALERSTGKLCSVVNGGDDYKGVNKNGVYALSKKPITNMTLKEFREAARKRGSIGWNCYTYEAHFNLYWLYVVEYATLNSQSDYNEQKTSEGFCQGGLGVGVNREEMSYPDEYDGSGTYVPCGTTDSAGNNTTQVTFPMSCLWGGSLWEEYHWDAKVPRYRGIENPFGHLGKMMDGVIVIVSPNEDNGGDGTSKVYVCSNPADFNDEDVSHYRYVGAESRIGGFVKQIEINEYGDMVPAITEGGSSSTYYCDYVSVRIHTNEEKRILYNNAVDNPSGWNGFMCLSSTLGAGKKFVDLGTRLCFIPQK